MATHLRSDNDICPKMHSEDRVRMHLLARGGGDRLSIDGVDRYQGGKLEMHRIRQTLKYHYMHFGEKHMHFSILQHALLHPARDKIGIATVVTINVQRIWQARI